MKQHRLSAGLLGLSLFCLALTAPALADTLPPLSTAGQLGEQLFSQLSATGMVLVVVRSDGTSFFQGYGESSPGSGAPPDEHSVVRLCSLTKIFTAELLARMVGAHQVQLTSSLQAAEPAWARAQPPPMQLVTSRRGRGAARVRNAMPERAELPHITLLELATHTAGLPREIGETPAGRAHFTYPDHRERWLWLEAAAATGTPGARALYSNVGFDFLSDALAHAAGQPYAELLESTLLAPLKLWHTTLYPSAAQCALLLRGQGDEGPCTSTEATEGSSGLYSTAADMRLWLGFLLRQGPGGGAQAVQLSPVQLGRAVGLDHAGEPTAMGLGWVHILPLNSQDHIAEKTGGGAGFSTYIAINHARGTALFLAVTGGGPRPEAPQQQEHSASEHLNVFNAANKLLLTVSGLPPLPSKAELPVVSARTHVLVGKRHARRRRR